MVSVFCIADDEKTSCIRGIYGKKCIKIENKNCLNHRKQINEHINDKRTYKYVVKNHKRC